MGLDNGDEGEDASYPEDLEGRSKKMGKEAESESGFGNYQDDGYEHGTLANDVPLAKERSRGGSAVI
jgi:hypothetical protein